MFEKFKERVLNRYILIPMAILLFLPSIISVILGLLFTNLPYRHIPTIIVNHDQSATARNLVQMIADNEIFDVVEYGAQDVDIKNAIDQNRAMAGILIPEDFSQNILNGKQSSIMVFNDGAMSPAVSNVRGAIAETLGTIKSGYMIKMVEGKLNMTPNEVASLISPMGYEARLLGNPTKNIAHMFLQGMLLTSVQVGVVAVGSSIRERRSYRTLLVKGLICALVGTVSAISSVYIQTKFFAFPYRGTALGGLLLTFFCCLGFSYFGILSNMSAKGDIEGAVQKCSMVGLTMLLSGYTYPLISMPKIFQKIDWFLPNTHYILPLRDISLLGTSYQEVSHHVVWMVGFAACMLLAATAKFFSAKYVKPKLFHKKEQLAGNEAVAEK